MAYVVVRDHNGKVLQKATLLDKPLIVGRSAECDIRIRDTQVSREHCELTPTPEGWLLRDRTSRNGIYVNGKPVREHLLCDGDVIEVGPSRIGFFAAANRRARAADPVLAGLIDAESASSGRAPSSSWPASNHAPSESSLYATRVMVAINDESTVAGAQGVTQNRTNLQAQPTTATLSIVQGPPAKTVRRKWGTLVGALGLIAASVAVWLFRG